MEQAEAVRRGCTLAYLDTFNFQAPVFYERLGYEQVHKIASFPREAQNNSSIKSASADHRPRRV